MINILMIEDDPEFSLFLGLSSGVDKYDLLILDLTLPRMDGLEVCEEVSRKYDIPIIISSARADATDKIMGLQIGADYYLPKPYDPKETYKEKQQSSK